MITGRTFSASTYYTSNNSIWWHDADSPPLEVNLAAGKSMPTIEYGYLDNLFLVDAKSCFTVF